jgi:hypothetical protein
MKNFYKNKMRAMCLSLFFASTVCSVDKTDDSAVKQNVKKLLVVAETNYDFSINIAPKEIYTLDILPNERRGFVKNHIQKSILEVKKDEIGMFEDIYVAQLLVKNEELKGKKISVNSKEKFEINLEDSKESLEKSVKNILDLLVPGGTLVVDPASSVRERIGPMYYGNQTVYGFIHVLDGAEKILIRACLKEPKRPGLVNTSRIYLKKEAGRSDSNIDNIIMACNEVIKNEGCNTQDLSLKISPLQLMERSQNDKGLKNFITSYSMYMHLTQWRSILEKSNNVIECEIKYGKISYNGENGFHLTCTKKQIPNTVVQSPKDISNIATKFSLVKD